MLRDTALEDITEHALFYRDPADCHVYGRGRVTLLGDAAHLTAAALGQVRPLGGLTMRIMEMNGLIVFT